MSRHVKIQSNRKTDTTKFMLRMHRSFLIYFLHSAIATQHTGRATRWASKLLLCAWAVSAPDKCWVYMQTGLAAVVYAADPPPSDSRK